MTLPIPLSVRLITSRADRHIEGDLSGLSFRTVVPGGFASCRVTLNRGLKFQPDEIAYYGRLIVYDGRNGNTVWEGRIEDMGRGVGSQGEVYDLAAVGGSAHAQDRTMPHVFVDSRVDDWESGPHGVTYIDIADMLRGTADPVIKFQLPQGTTFVQLDFAEILYRRLIDTGQKLARVVYAWDAGSTTANSTIKMWLTTGLAGAGQVPTSATLSTAGGTLTGVISDAIDETRDDDTAHVMYERNGPSVTAADTSGSLWLLPFIRPILFNKSGTARIAAADYTLNTVFAHEVIEDLLGRMLTQFDGANASIETDSYGIDQLAYRDGVTAAKILEDLMVFHPSKYWAAWERNPTTDKHRFEWRSWPTHVRYDADVIDGFNSPGSAVNLFNQVNIQFVGGQGHRRHKQRTSTVDVLDDAGLIRQHHIDLGFDAGSEANAIQTGDEFLAEHATPPNAGTLMIARPILDRDRGMMVMPWEIRPGHLVRVSGVNASPDALNATGRDGVTVFRVVGVDFDASSAAATLELDSSPVTLAHFLARK